MASKKIEFLGQLAWRASLTALTLAAGVSVWGCSSSPAASPNDLGGGDAGSNSGGTGNSGGAGNGTGGSGTSSGGGSSTGGSYDGPGAGGPAYSERSAANILFSGHSLLDNPIADWTVAIAEAKGDAVGWEQQIVIGSPISVRTKGSGAPPGDPPWNGYGQGKDKFGLTRSTSILSELANPTLLPSGQRYDTLIITEGHHPIGTMLYENTGGFLRHYHDRITDHAENGRTLFYQVWPDIDKANPQAWIDFMRLELAVWECIAEKVNLSLESEGRTRSVAVVPGGNVLVRVVEEALAGNIPGITGTPLERLNFIFEDNVHLQYSAKYIISAALYAAAYGKSPVGAHAAEGLADDTMTAIETIAWNEVSSYFESGYPEGRPLDECRTLIENEICPASNAFRGRSEACDYQGGAESPFQYPADFLYPAP